jgi:hypothetical protein
MFCLVLLLCFVDRVSVVSFCCCCLDVFFGWCDLDEKSELATKQGVTTSSTFHIYQGMERVEEVSRGQ